MQINKADANIEFASAFVVLVIFSQFFELSFKSFDF